MNPQGFDRALDFFRYSRVAAWTAQVASLLTGFVFVALLVLLGLFFDLCVNQGKVPCLAQAPRIEREQFLKSIQLPEESEPRKERVKAFVEHVRDLKLGDPSLERLAEARLGR